MPNDPRYFVTSEGLAQAFHAPDLETLLDRVLRGDAPKATVRELLARNLIGVERRSTAQVDHNLLLLGGVLTRMRELLPKGEKNNRPHATPPPEVKDLRTMPRKLYRLSRTDLTDAELRRLPAAARKVFVALQRSDVGTIKTLAEQTGLNRRTVENATGALRKAGVIEDFDFKR